jgi:hypothetical protein
MTGEEIGQPLLRRVMAITDQQQLPASSNAPEGGRSSWHHRARAPALPRPNRADRGLQPAQT